MPRRRQYRLPNSRHRRARRATGLAVLVVLAGLAWWWWQATQQTPPPDASSPPPTTSPISAPPPSLPAATTTNLPASNQLSPAPPLAVVTGTARATGDEFPREPKDVLEMQIALARRAFSSGSIDGVMGAQTRAALRAFQRQQQLTETGELDAPTRARLELSHAALTNRLIIGEDRARLQPVSATWLGKSQQTALEYETLLELVAEQSQASPNLLRRLNPSVNWSDLTAGAMVRIPAVSYPEPTGTAALIHISLSEKRLQVWDSNTNVLAHFPCSIAARVEKRPAGELMVTAIAPDPNYTFDPARFPESPEAQQLQRKLILPPGPNNPVGTAWISLSLPGYGMHGTPSPEQVGRTESHGCFRLANWNAEYLLKLVRVGMPVVVEP